MKTQIKKIGSISIWLIFTIIVILILSRACIKAETVKRHYPVYSSSLKDILPADLQFEDARDIYLQWNIDTNDIWSKMNVTEQIFQQITHKFNVVEKSQITGRNHRGVCETSIEWWSQKICSDSRAKFYWVNFPAPYEAALPTTGILVVLEDSLFYYQPPHGLK